MGLCWVNEGAGHSRLQEQEKQRDRVMRPQRPGETQSLSEVGEVRRSQKGREGQGTAGPGALPQGHRAWQCYG